MNDITKAAVKEAGRRIGAVGSVKAQDILSNMFTNYAKEHPEKVEIMFNKIMTFAFELISDDKLK